MIVYLDQNKWIELARIYYRKETNQSSIDLLEEIEAASRCGCIFPLSAIHYMEFSRIADAGRRSRLGRVMWKYSQGQTIASLNEIVLMEIESAFAPFFPEIKIRKVNIIGRGISHAFGEKIKDILPTWMSEIVEEAIFTGFGNIEPISFSCQKYRKKFLSHLTLLHETKHQLDKNQWEDWLHAITFIDILEPIYTVFKLHNIDLNRFMKYCSADFLSEIIEEMPTRKLDLHLHRQVLKNPKLKHKLTDLEDWAGLGMAACYCDVVVCEKHFANMVKRDSFKTRAHIETSLYSLFKNISFL